MAYIFLTYGSVLSAATGGQRPYAAVLSIEMVVS